ncbi:ABC transporter ATP-binding protein [Aerococcus mictus]|uniref:ABC transporter ATP-binding protein n=1 Tax=Aerococcus mictus TaxID=2976810 RepID=UPI0022778811|nr:ABC transporter ATP-binding protein [Aerococcus mictus]MCY3067129.1 ABC transporter ATP-binding protein/permease [Aerococcus mictus]
MGRRTPKSTSKALKRLFKFFGHYQKSFIAVVILSVAATIAETVAPKILGQATTLIAEGVSQGLQEMNGQMGYKIDFTGIFRVLLVVAALYIATSIGRYFQNYLLSHAVQGTIANLRQAMRDKLNKLPISTIDHLSTGEILSRAINDIENIARTLQQNIAQTIMSITQLIGVVTMILMISPKIGGLMILTVLFAVFLVSRITPITQRLFADRQRIQGSINDHIEEDYNGQIEIRAFNQQGHKRDLFEEETDAYYKTSQRAEFFSGFLYPMVNFIRNLDYVLIAFVGGIDILLGRLPLGDVQALLQYNPQLYQPISNLATIVNQIQSTLASAERVFEFLDLEEMEVTHSDYSVIDTDKKVIFDNVYFGYDEDHYTLKDYNLDVNEGETIAIVGPTGAGKTTLINLLERFYDVDKGSIKIDGKDIRDYSREDVRKQMGMVLQDTWLFNGSIYDNIAYGDHNQSVSEEEVYAAAKTAHVDDFVRKLPDGYDTIINEDASNISQGQRQLITIARALVATPDILILDEATSSIDTRTEELIQKATEKLLKGRTSFVIAHRLSTIQDADQIIVMDQGRIIEKGNHESLMEKRGFYYGLYSAQFQED